MDEVLGEVEGRSDLFVFYCPGCEYCHHLDTTRWKWNGSLTKPTATPSLLVNKLLWGSSPRCHFFMQNGTLRFLGDCTHALAGTTVSMQPWSY